MVKTRASTQPQSLITQAVEPEATSRSPAEDPTRSVFPSSQKPWCAPRVWSRRAQFLGGTKVASASRLKKLQMKSLRSLKSLPLLLLHVPAPLRRPLVAMSDGLLTSALSQGPALWSHMSPNNSALSPRAGHNRESRTGCLSVRSVLAVLLGCFNRVPPSEGCDRSCHGLKVAVIAFDGSGKTHTGSTEAWTAHVDGLLPATSTYCIQELGQLQTPRRFTG